MDSPELRLLSYMVPGFPLSLFTKIASVVSSALELDETRSGPAPGDDPFAEGRADLGWICSTSFVELSIRAPEPSVELAGVAWVPDDPGVEGRPVYFADVVVRPDSPIADLAALGGGRIGCNDHISLSGHHALRLALGQRGFEPDAFADLVFTGGHHSSLELLLAGELDAAVVDSVVRTRAARATPAIARLRLVDRLGPWPVQPLVARSSMAKPELEAVKRRLLDAADQPGVQRELHNAALATLTATSSAPYEALANAMAT